MALFLTLVHARKQCDKYEAGNLSQFQSIPEISKSVSICLRAFPAAPLAIFVCKNQHMLKIKLLDAFLILACAPLSLEFIYRNTGIIIQGEPALNLSYPVFRQHHPHPHPYHPYHHRPHHHHVELRKEGRRSWKWHGRKNMQKKTMQQAVR